MTGCGADDDRPGTVRFERGARPGLPAIAGTASDLLLWLCRRVELPVPAGARGVDRPVHALTYPD